MTPLETALSLSYSSDVRDRARSLAALRALSASLVSSCDEVGAQAYVDAFLDGARAGGDARVAALGNAFTSLADAITAGAAVGAIKQELQAGSLRATQLLRAALGAGKDCSETVEHALGRAAAAGALSGVVRAASATDADTALSETLTLLWAACDDACAPVRSSAHGALCASPVFERNIPAALPRLLFARYYGPDVSRGAAQAAWRRVIDTGVASRAVPNSAAAPALNTFLSSAITRALGGGDGLSRSAAAFFAPGAEGVSRDGPLLVHAHLESVITHVRTCICDAASNLRGARNELTQLHAACAAIEAALLTVAEFASKVPRVDAFALDLLDDIGGVVDAVTDVREGLEVVPPPEMPPWVPRWWTINGACASVLDGALSAAARLLALAPVDGCSRWLEHSARFFSRSVEHATRHESSGIRTHAAYVAGVCNLRWPDALANSTVTAIACGFDGVVDMLNVGGAARPKSHIESTRAVEGAAALLRELANARPVDAAALFPSFTAAFTSSVEHLSALITSSSHEETLAAAAHVESLLLTLPDTVRGLARIPAGRSVLRKTVDALLESLALARRLDVLSQSSRPAAAARARALALIAADAVAVVSEAVGR